MNLLTRGLLGAGGFLLTRSLGDPGADITPPVVVHPSDHAAYRAIQTLLRETGEFEKVMVGREFEREKLPAKWQTVAHIQPLGNPEARPDGSPLHVLNIATYRLTIYLRRRTDELAYRALDRLKDVVLNTLLSEANRAYGGFCHPWMTSLLVEGIPAGDHEGLSQRFRGRFGYTANLVRGYDTTKPG